MPRYHVTLTDTEIQELKSLIQCISFVFKKRLKGWKGLSYKKTLACSNLTKAGSKA